MKLTKLEIRRTETYSTPANVLVGLVELTGPTGQQSITLSAGAISRLIAAVAAEVALTAKANAKQVATGLDEAQHEVLLLESDGTI